MERYIQADIVFSKFAKNYTEMKKDLPIRPSEMAMLDVVVENEGRCTPVMIAELLEVSKPMVTAHITALENKGYIKKECSKDDKRSFFVIPTEKAKSLVKSELEATSACLYELENELGRESYEKLLYILNDTNRKLADMKKK